MHTYVHTYIHTYVRTDRRTDRQTDGRTDRRADRQTDRDTGRQSGRQAGSQAGSQAGMHTYIIHTHVRLCARANHSVCQSANRTILRNASLSFSERQRAFCIHFVLKQEQPWCSCQHFSPYFARRIGERILIFSCIFWCCSS